MVQPVIPYNATYDAFGQSQIPGWSYYNPWAGAPGGAIGQQVVSMVGQQAMNNAGYVPMGMNWQGGLYNNIQQQMFSASHLQSMQQASEFDMQAMLSAQKGMMAMAGQKVGAKEEQALMSFNQFAVKAAPFVDPRMLDVLTGGRSNVNLAHAIHLGGFGRRDIVTGGMGMSGDTSAHVAKGLWQHYFSDPNYGYKTAGLTSLQMGDMFDELSRRGMMAPVGTLRERVVGGLMAAEERGANVQDILRNSGVNAPGFARGDASALTSLTDADLQKLSKNTDVQGGMRNVDATRIKDTLDKYKGAIGAVQEIFGDAGRPNAPMRELLNALEQLTQGGMQQISAGRTEMVVRNMYNAAKSAGVDMATVSGMMAAAGQQTDAMGRNPLFASQMAYGGLLFGAAYNSAGLGANPAWGLQNQKQMMGAAMAAEGRGINSELGNRLGTLLRLDERVGGMGGMTGRILNDVRNGVMDGRLADMGYGDFLRMVSADSGLSQNQIETALRHKQQNEEYIYSNNLGSLISRYAQPHEANRKMLRPAAEAQANSMAQKVLGRGDHRGLSSRISANLVASWRSMNATVMSDTKARTISGARDVYDYIEREAKNNPGSEEAKLYSKLSGMSEKDRNRELQMYVENSWGEAEQQYMEVYGGEPMVNMFLRQSVAAGQEKDKITAEVTLKSALEKRAAGVFAGGSPLFNFVRAMQQAGNNPNEAQLRDVLAKSLGGVGKKELAGKLASDLIALDREQDKLTEMQTTGIREASSMSKEAADALDKKVKLQSETIEKAKSEIESFMNANGLTEVLGSLIEGEGKAGGNETAMNFNGATFNITAPEGTLTLKNAKGNAVAKNEGRGASGVATA